MFVHALIAVCGAIMLLPFAYLGRSVFDSLNDKCGCPEHVIHVGHVELVT